MGTSRTPGSSGTPRSSRTPGTLHSLNVGAARPHPRIPGDITGIDKRPVDHAVEVRAPGPRTGEADSPGSGLVGDFIGNRRNHGGDDQAVYAYAREDLDAWGSRLGQVFPDGGFGENLTTLGIEVTGALIGERWRIGEGPDAVLLEVSTPRIPCRTFARWLDIAGWLKVYTLAAIPGAYLRVVTPGRIEPGMPVEVEHRPGHDVTVGLAFRAFTLEPELLPRLVDVEALPAEERARARRRLPYDVDPDD